MNVEIDNTINISQENLNSNVEGQEMLLDRRVLQDSKIGSKI